jgi:hypothetical protein
MGYAKRIMNDGLQNRTIHETLTSHRYPVTESYEVQEKGTYDFKVGCAPEQVWNCKEVCLL